MSIKQVILISVLASMGIIFVFFHRKIFEILLNIKESVSDFFISLKYGNFTEREESIVNVYINYHYPRYSPYRSYCWNCNEEVNSSKSPRCPVCGIYICLNCGSCHPKCTDRDKKIYISEKEVREMLQGSKASAIKNRIKTVRDKANDKIYYCAPVEKEFGAISGENGKNMKE